MLCAIKALSSISCTVFCVSFITENNVTEPGVTPRCSNKYSALPKDSRLQPSAPCNLLILICVSLWAQMRKNAPALSLRNRFLVFAPSILALISNPSSTVKIGACSMVLWAMLFWSKKANKSSRLAGIGSVLLNGLG